MASGVRCAVSGLGCLLQRKDEEDEKDKEDKEEDEEEEEDMKNER